jgi:hypothetical protein
VRADRIAILVTLGGTAICMLVGCASPRVVDNDSRSGLVFRIAISPERSTEGRIFLNAVLTNESVTPLEMGPEFHLADTRVRWLVRTHVIRDGRPFYDEGVTSNRESYVRAAWWVEGCRPNYAMGRWFEGHGTRECVVGPLELPVPGVYQIWCTIFLPWEHDVTDTIAAHIAHRADGLPLPSNVLTVTR